MMILICVCVRTSNRFVCAKIVHRQKRRAQPTSYTPSRYHAQARHTHTVNCGCGRCAYVVVCVETRACAAGTRMSDCEPWNGYVCECDTTTPDNRPRHPARQIRFDSTQRRRRTDTTPNNTNRTDNAKTKPYPIIMYIELLLSVWWCAFTYKERDLVLQLYF